MVTITAEFASGGRNIDNKLFTYVVSKIIADEHGYYLNVPEPSYIHRNGIITNFPYYYTDGIKITEPYYHVSDGTMSQFGIDIIIEENKNKNTFINGYFLKYGYIKNDNR